MTAIAGSFVLYNDNLGHIAGLGDYLVDVRTGARTVLPLDALPGTFAHGVIAGFVATPREPDSDTSVARLDSTKLPTLHC